MSEKVYTSYGDYYRGNEFLSMDEMTVNARMIFTYLNGIGKWSVNAICALLGNAQTESSLNPAIWQNLTVADSNGYGLVQWTPSTKFTSWCTENSRDPYDMIANLDRILYEVENGLQWISTNTYPLSFKEFTTSNESIEYLTNAFLYNYERPAETPQPKRAEQALSWYSVITSGEIPTPPTPPTPSNKGHKMDLLLLLTASRRHF